MIKNINPWHLQVTVNLVIPYLSPKPGHGGKLRLTAEPGHLIWWTILSEKQNEAAHNVSMSKKVWIGLFKDPWEWLDGSNSSFRYWKPNQPNYRKDQDCTAAIFKDEGKWNDLKCSTTLPFICQGGKFLFFIHRILFLTQYTTELHLSSSQCLLIHYWFLQQVN